MFQNITRWKLIKLNGICVPAENNFLQFSFIHIVVAS